MAFLWGLGDAFLSRVGRADAGSCCLRATDVGALLGRVIQMGPNTTIHNESFPPGVTLPVVIRSIFK